MIMETFNKKDDPRSNLLYSLKPYLRETRQKKLDQYVNLFKITQVSNLFKKEKESISKKEVNVLALRYKNEYLMSQKLFYHKLLSYQTENFLPFSNKKYISVEIK